MVKHLLKENKGLHTLHVDRNKSYWWKFIWVTASSRHFVITLFNF